MKLLFPKINVNSKFGCCSNILGYNDTFCPMLKIIHRRPIPQKIICFLKTSISNIVQKFHANPEILEKLYLLNAKSVVTNWLIQANNLSEFIFLPTYLTIHPSIHSCIYSPIHLPNLSSNIKIGQEVCLVFKHNTLLAKFYKYLLNFPIQQFFRNHVARVWLSLDLKQKYCLEFSYIVCELSTVRFLGLFIQVHFFYSFYLKNLQLHLIKEKCYIK